MRIPLNSIIDSHYQNWLSIDVLILLAPCDLILVISAVPLMLVLLEPRDSHERDSHSMVSSISLAPLLDISQLLPVKVASTLLAPLVLRESPLAFMSSE